MNQTILIVGFVILLAIQIGFINIKPITGLFQGSGYESDGDEDYDDTRRRNKRRTKHHRRHAKTNESAEKYIPGTEIHHHHPHSATQSSISKKSQSGGRRHSPTDEELMTSLDSLPSDISRKIPIRGSELTQDQSIPWKQTPNTREYSAGDDPEEIQMKIMEELEANTMNHSQLMPSPF
jgi:hypothetical protein